MTAHPDGRFASEWVDGIRRNRMDEMNRNQWTDIRRNEWTICVGISKDSAGLELPNLFGQSGPKVAQHGPRHEMVGEVSLTGQLGKQ